MNMGYRRWSARWIHRTILVSALWGLPSLAWCQNANVPPPSVTQGALPEKLYTKSTSFNLPVHIDDRSYLREICLYMKFGNGDWIRQETGLPNVDHFGYKAAQDGEYAFSLVTIDKSGRASPGDVNQEPPLLRVVVDTQPPVLDVQPWTSADGDFCLRCTMQDLNPNPSSIRAVCKTPQGDRPLDPMPNQPGIFRILGAELMSYPVRFTGRDQAGNSATVDVNVKDMVQASLIPTVAKNSMPTVQPLSNRDTTLPMIPSNEGPVLVKSESNRVPLPTAPPPPVAPAIPLPYTSTVSLPPPPQPTFSAEPAVHTAPTGAPGQRQILNTTHASIDYRIDQVGPSGVSRVEVYMTADQGTTWQRLGEDLDRRSPAEVDLPGEGVFGIRLAVTNGNGFGGNAPVRGDQPTCVIEVDTTAPFAQLRPIEPVTQNGALELRWTASDKNLGPEPIALYFRTRPEAAWQAIARGLKNDGVYRWSFPRDMGAQFFVKLEVTDEAGNVARVETPSPIVLDMAEPRAQVVGVTGMNAHATVPQGN